ncbi:MAG: UxaA family hydrolase, partial [Cyclobacteriaceae bacterium]|nr:UxaA family hydrolase [Cyclobacteriaceae bacterium]
MKFLQIHSHDNVLVALTDLKKGEELIFNDISITLKMDIPAKHKFAIHTLQAGEGVFMYGILIGKAVQMINSGERLTTFNVKHATTKPELRKSTFTWNPPDVSQWKNKTFNGYYRSDGKVG